MLDQQDTLNLQQRRRLLRRKAGCRFVDPAEFCLLAVSNRELFRSDDKEAECRGLFDPSTGEWFLTEEEKLVLHHVTQAW